MLSGYHLSYELYESIVTEVRLKFSSTMIVEKKNNALRLNIVPSQQCMNAPRRTIPFGMSTPGRDESYTACTFPCARARVLAIPSFHPR